MEAVALSLSGLGTILAVIVNISPISSLLKANKTKSLEEISHLYLLLANCNTTAWVIYSLKASKFPILVPNSLNFVLSLGFLAWYHKIAEDALKFLTGYFLTVGSAVAVGYGLIPIDKLGIACVVVNFLGFAAPLEQVKPLLAEKDPRYLDMNVVGACFGCSFVWGVYGILTRNIFVITPNIAGFVICLLLTLMNAWARNWLPHFVFGGFVKLVGKFEKEELPLKGKPN